MKKRIIFLLSHPIQYFSPLFQRMAKEKDIDLLVLYCSDENVKGHIDKGFGVHVDWDIPLLDGYNFRFLKNNSWKPSIFNGFFGLINFEVVKILHKEKDCLVIICGWSNLTYVLAIFLGRLFGHKIGVRGDNTLLNELKKPKILRFIKRILLSKILFQFVDIFMFVGKQNKEFYEYYSIKAKKLLFVPHAVDNLRFNKYFLTCIKEKDRIKKELNIDAHTKIILFVGKLIDIKRPFDLLYAYEKLNKSNYLLIFVGDGILRRQLELTVMSKRFYNINFVGFINQIQIAKYYLISDVLVVCSESETWGFVINEGLNFALPVIATDTVGCVPDLVEHGKNGFVYRMGDYEQLSIYLNEALNNEDFRLKAGQESINKIQLYSYEKDIEQILGYIHSL